MMKIWLRLLVVSVTIFWMMMSKPVVAQEDPALQVLRKIMAEMESQSNQRTPTGENKNNPPTIGNGDNRSVVLGRASFREAAPPIKETRVYDLADLFALAPSFLAQGWVGWDNSLLLPPNGGASGALTGATGGMGGGMGGMMRIPSLPNSTPAIDQSWKPTPSDLMQAIESTVDAKWESKGGEETMHWLGSSLLITAYPDTHTMVKRLLELLQTRWNARVTLETRVHWLWLSFSEEEKLGKLMVPSDASPVRSMDIDALSKFLVSLPLEATRPNSIHARLHCHNGQSVSWVSGNQQRSVAGWERTKGGLIPVPSVAQRGVACEVMPMLAHASEHATIVFNSRYVLAEEAGAKGETNIDAPLPDRDRVNGQSIASTVRLPIGRGTMLGGGSSVESGNNNWQLAVVISIELVSPREPTAQH
jgi:hypothetical protein